MHEDWQQPYVDRATEIADELNGIIDTMNELVVDHLRTAGEEGVDGRPPLDKHLQAARRALEKAVNLLGRD